MGQVKVLAPDIWKTQSHHSVLVACFIHLCVVAALPAVRPWFCFQLLTLTEVLSLASSKSAFCCLTVTRGGFSFSFLKYRVIFTSCGPVHFVIMN